MLLLYKFLSKALNGILNLMFVLQITLLILVFFTSTYWFCDLIDAHLFDFAEPIVAVISDLVKVFYYDNIEIGGIYVDGSLLVFCILAVLVVFGLTKLKFYIYNALADIDNCISKCNKRIEENFNKSLEKEVENRIKVCNNTAILIQFEVKNMFVDAVWGGDVLSGTKQKEEEAFKIFYSAVKNSQGCKFAKTDDKMLIIFNDFEQVDLMLEQIEVVISKIKSDFKKEKYLLLSYVVVDVFDNNTNFKAEIYPLLEKLLTLRHKCDPICMSSFCMRYKYKKNQMFVQFLKGEYNFNEEETKVWALVKKS